VHYHLLTSAFSYLGNDGQPDYGAANEALSRIAAVMDDPQRGPHWSAMGWLGWAGIGMTRGSEFAALAASRRLRGVTKEEGRQLFAEMMSGVPMTPINILLADGEMQYYGVALADAPAHVLEIATWDRRLQKQEDTICHHVTLDNAPFLIDHVVNGTPTMPASFLTCIVSDAAKQLRPDLQIAAYENTHYYRFVRVPRDSGAQIRVHSRVVSEDEREAVVHVQVLSDFVHKTGRVLQKDILHNETFIRMSRRLPEPPKSAFEAHSVDGLLLQDPYVMPESKVRLNGQFASMRDIRVGPVHRMARYKLLDYHYPASLYGYLLSNMICVDAFWRFGTVRLVGDRTLGVYVPERCGVMRVYFDYTAFDSEELTKTLTFRGTNPTAEDDLLHVGPIDVCDSNGNVLLVVERGVCRKFGEVRSPL
jgi:polyketide synthase family protein